MYNMLNFSKEDVRLFKLALWTIMAVIVAVVFAVGWVVGRFT